MVYFYVLTFRHANVDHTMQLHLRHNSILTIHCSKLIMFFERAYSQNV